MFIPFFNQALRHLRQEDEMLLTSDNDWEKLLKSTGFAFFKQGTVLFNQGDPGDFFFVNIHGRINLYLPNPHVKPI